MEVGSAYFEQRLSVFGHWISHPAWGQVWQPDAGRNFRPYFYGYWQYTSDYGWLWVSNEPYGDIVYHYGRWVYDPNFGWLWVPGYVWAPSWVAWRETDGYIGWLPMPPGYQDFSLNTVTPSYGPNELYGYQYFYGSNFTPDAFTGLWLFAPTQDFGRSDRRRYVFDKDRVRDLYRHSQDRTHYLHDRDRDRIVDRSIDKDELERSTHRHFDAPQGRQFLRPDTPMVPVTEGQEIARRDRDRNRVSVRGWAAGEANRAQQNAPAGVAGHPGLGTAPPEFPQFGRGLRGFGRRDEPQALGQTGAAPDPGAQNPGLQSQPNTLRREPGRVFPGRNSTAFGAAGALSQPNIPSTELTRGAQSPLVPGVVAPSAPQMGSQPGIIVPGRDPGRAPPRRFGLGAVLSGPAPGAVTAAPPPVPLAGLQPVPVVPAIPAAQPVAPPMPAAAAPQATPQIGPQRSPRSPMGSGGSQS